MRLVTGDKLSPDLRRQVLAAYVNRHLDTTCKTDEDWLRTHAFYVTARGTLSRRHKHCEPAFMAKWSE